MERPLKPFPMPPQDTDLDDPAVSQQPDFFSRPAHRRPNNKQSRLMSKTWLIAGIVLLLIVLGGALYLYKHRHIPAKPPAKSATSIVHPTVKTNSPSKTGNYVSNGSDLNLNLTYPTDWSITPPTNDNASDQAIVITSPLESVTNSAGATVTGKAVVAIRPGSAQIGELASGNAIASQTSIQIGFTTPSASQQQYPFLTFIDLAGGSDPSGAFDEVMITGQGEFSQGEAVTSQNLGTLDPIISASFYSCTTQACTGSGEAPLSINSTTWQNSAPFTQVLTIFQSLQLN